MILIITVTGMVYNGRGYHTYMDIWTPVEDEMLRLIPEPTNSRNAVAVMKEGQIVGHVPFNLSPLFHCS